MTGSQQTVEDTDLVCWFIVIEMEFDMVHGLILVMVMAKMMILLIYQYCWD